MAQLTQYITKLEEATKQQRLMQGAMSSIQGMDFSAETAKFMRQQTVPSAPAKPPKPAATGGKPAKDDSAAKAADEALKKSQEVEDFFANVDEAARQRDVDRLRTFMEGLTARADALRQSNMNEYQLAEEKYQAEVEQLAKAKEAIGLTEEEYTERLLQIRMDRDQRMMDADIAMLDAEKATAEQRMALAEQVANHAEKVQRENTQRIIGLLSMLGTKNKAFALASIALQTKTAYVQNKVTTLQAGNLAFASAIIPGDPTSLARAQAAKAFALSQGAITGGLILAAGAVQAAGALSSGGGGGGGSYSSGSSYSAPSSPATTATVSNQTITIQGMNSGDIFSGDAVRTLIDKLIDAQRNGARIVLA
jgi:hypothetical protein